VKLVIGIVRPEKANDVLEALYRAEVRGISVSRVQGHGGELDRVETYRGTTVKIGLSDKVDFRVPDCGLAFAADRRPPQPLGHERSRDHTSGIGSITAGGSRVKPAPSVFRRC